MKIFSTTTLLLSVFLAAFGYWGIFTAAGQKTFDEMAGMIPFFALVVAAILFCIFLLLLVRAAYLKRKSK